jgi:uncharacterized protein YciI
MDKIHYTLYLNPPRPNFMQDMNEQERSIMQKHIDYWNKLMTEGKVLAFGPVLDSNGIYGLGIVEVENEDPVKTMISGDPANGLNKYEYYLMRAVVPKK